MTTTRYTMHPVNERQCTAVPTTEGTWVRYEDHLLLEIAHNDALARLAARAAMPEVTLRGWYVQHKERRKLGFMIWVAEQPSPPALSDEWEVIPLYAKCETPKEEQKDG